jgi:hypothetical protein
MRINIINVLRIRSLKKKGGFRARHQCAEQENPGGQTGNLNWRKGVVAMAKHVFNKTTHVCPVRLAILGWLAFGVGQVVDSIGLKLVLLSAARVLPEVLRS